MPDALAIRQSVSKSILIGHTAWIDTSPTNAHNLTKVTNAQGILERICTLFAFNRLFEKRKACVSLSLWSRNILLKWWVPYRSTVTFVENQCSIFTFHNSGLTNKSCGRQVSGKSAVIPLSSQNKTSKSNPAFLKRYCSASRQHF